MPDAHDEPVRPWQRRLVTGLGVLVLIHSTILILWLAPSSPIRDLVGSRNLASYVDPYFQQGVDPSVQFVDESFQIRAFVRNGTAEPTVTEWVDVTKKDLGDLKFNPSPARVHVIARRLASNLNLSMSTLEPEQRKIIRESGATDTSSSRSAKLNRAGGKPSVVQNYLAYEQMATRFASLYAISQWQGKVVQVQFRAGRRAVPGYSIRAETKLRDIDYRWFIGGWRVAFRGSVEAQSPYAAFVRG